MSTIKYDTIQSVMENLKDYYDKNLSYKTDVHYFNKEKYKLELKERISMRLKIKTLIQKYNLKGVEVSKSCSMHPSEISIIKNNVRMDDISNSRLKIMLKNLELLCIDLEKYPTETCIEKHKAIRGNETSLISLINLKEVAILEINALWKELDISQAALLLLDKDKGRSVLNTFVSLSVKKVSLKKVIGSILYLRELKSKGIKGTESLTKISKNEKMELVKELNDLINKKKIMWAKVSELNFCTKSIWYSIKQEKVEAISVAYIQNILLNIKIL